MVDPVTTPGETDGSGDDSPASTPLTVGWRRVATGSPALWRVEGEGVLGPHGAGGLTRVGFLLTHCLINLSHQPGALDGPREPGGQAASTGGLTPACLLSSVGHGSGNKRPRGKGA